MPGHNSSVFRFSDVEVHEGELHIRRNGNAVPVEPKAFRILLHLLRNHGRLIPKEELIKAGWGETAVTDNSLTRNIALLRRLLDDDPREPRYIETVSTVGYRFICPVITAEVLSSSVPAVDSPNGKTGDGTVEILPGSVADDEGASDGLNGPEPAPEPREFLRTRRRLISVAGVVICALGFAAWSLLRPLRPLRVTEYTPITHVGYIGAIAGTDGARLYFNSDVWGSVEYAVSVFGGEITTVPLELGHIWIRDVSPDGSHLLVHSLDPSALWSVGTLGGPAQFITKVEHTQNHQFSPDGKYIAYSDGQTGAVGIYVMGSDGANVRKLATVKEQIIDLTWSPDGSRMRFTMDDRLWEVSSSGANLHPLFPTWNGPRNLCCGRWTPDGDFYVFLAGVGRAAYLGGWAQMWALDERRHFLLRPSTGPLQLTSGPIHWEVPIPSKDGKKIFAKGTIPRGELVRFDAKSKNLQPFLDGISAECISYSRDQNQMAYVSYPEGILWRAKPDGTARTQLTTPPTYPTVCSWSPDGTQIIFNDHLSSHWGVYTVPAYGGRTQPITPVDVQEDQYCGSWSTDGHRMAYTVGQLHSHLRILEVDRRTTTKIPGSDDLYFPRWSPDGRYIAALLGPDGAEVRVFNLQTQQWSTLLAHMGGWSFPAFSHDGRYLYALNFRGQPGYSVYRVPVSGGKPELVADLSGFHPIGAGGFWFGLDPEDNPLLLRNNGASDIYALTLDRR
jgi:Tol biopolymer transport system component/DNA-binding winged helix-turn-helix (wHTH) protein